VAGEGLRDSIKIAPRSPGKYMNKRTLTAQFYYNCEFWSRSDVAELGMGEEFHLNPIMIHVLITRRQNIN
jgi:hypothetical protein